MAVNTPLRTIVRAMTAVEAGHVVDTVFAGLSPRSRYLRFHSPIPRLTRRVRARLADLDGRERVALVAEVDGVPVGIARLVATEAGEAEMAVAVVDTHQRRGIGTRLLAALTELATELGYRALTGSVLPENAAMLALAERIAPNSRRYRDGDAVRIVVPLGAAAWTITHEDILAELLAR